MRISDLIVHLGKYDDNTLVTLGPQAEPSPDYIDLAAVIPRGSDDIHVVEILSGSSVIGKVSVEAEGSPDKLQMAASAIASITGVVIEGERFSKAEIEEWWA